MNRKYINRLETLDQFRSRTAWKDDPLRKIVVPADQNEKIRPDGSFQTILGDTVLFSLPDDTCQALGALRDALCRDHRNIFCAPLPQDSFHLTLHDLSTAPFHQREQIAELIRQHRQKVEPLLARFREDYPDPIRLKPTKLVSMMGRSVVLLFEPKEDTDCDALMDMYESLSDVVAPGFPYFTPHITLAYYKPAFISDGTAAALGESFSRVLGAHSIGELSLSCSQLSHRCFTSMARYCTCEEYFAHIEFDKMYEYALERLACGVSHTKVRRELAGFGLGMSTAKSERKMSASVGSMILNYPYNIKDPYENIPSCTGGAGGRIGHQFLCAAIIGNLYARGLLDETAKRLSGENARSATEARQRGDADEADRIEELGEADLLIRHCMNTLHWQQ